MKKSRLTAGFLALLMLAQLTLASCSNTGTDEQPNAGSAQPTATADETPVTPEETRIDPGLPERDFGGYDFRMLGKGTSNSHWKSMDLTA